MKEKNELEMQVFIKSFLFLLFFFFCHIPKCGVLVPQPGIEPELEAPAWVKS